jgi:hypothetical protein
MAIPPDAVQWRQPIDPTDRTNFVAQFGQLLEDGEIIDEVELTLLAESVALGLTIIEDAEHGPFIADDTNVELWFEVDEAHQSNAAFSGQGTTLPVQITITTDATPPRRYQRTMIVQVLQL